MISGLIVGFCAVEPNSALNSIMDQFFLFVIIKTERYICASLSETPWAAAPSFF
jgi:hypothetical protein